MRYDTQTLLFKETLPLSFVVGNALRAPEQFYEKGYAVFSGLPTADAALETLQRTIAGLDPARLPFMSRFLARMQLAKADVIPVCDDIVASSYQVLHFDMGHPLIAKEPQTMYFVTALYAPPDGQTRTAETRILPLRGLLSDARWGGEDGLRQNITRYVERHGDGWEQVNTHRLACFARLLDAAAGTTEVADEKNRTVGHWFHDKNLHDAEESWQNEREFCHRRGIDLVAREERVRLEPGQLLLFDNTRVVHGRMGGRKAKELYQFLLGVERVDQEDIGRFVSHLLSLLAHREPGPPCRDHAAAAATGRFATLHACSTCAPTN